ncbi:OstA-like protein [Chryseolinea lacunae]|uniref:Organic solvent tolerance protein OstA n=1 Tax=Chryseolinea lacunae TaxID=2801331 RepID=A0ABS1KKD2_9BACT|nr:OstA-like protein [Chryseolinea lacunae]MBL0739916.1 Organic solvent tolerance protein OstA [Chryseolinea lacunae]
MTVFCTSAFRFLLRPGMAGLVLLMVALAAAPAQAQKKVKLKQADQLRGTGKGDDSYQRVLGNVIFVQNTTTIFCDSAHFYKSKNYIEAFGSVRILEGDSVTITGNKLEYDGNVKKAKLRNNVVFTKLATSTLYTDNLDFDRPKNLAYYFNGGKLVDSINVLTSRKGYYDLTSNMASFKKDVHVKNPDYTMTSDSLQYNSRTKILFFRTPTNVVDKDSSTFVYNGGQYDTKTRRSDLKLGEAESTDYKLMGDDYQLDDIRKIYKLRDNVVMTSKKENIVIYGQAADYYKLKGLSKVYNNAYLAKVDDKNDTLFISADTLVSIDSPDPQKKRLLAYNHVKIWRKDLQGLADSIEYRSADSTIYFYKDPVLWTEGNQMTADSIRMLIKNGTIDRIFMNVNSFVISKDTLINYNQIKGRKMTAEFQYKKISQVIVEGNGESIYSILSEKKDDKPLTSMGLNRIICSNITIRFKEGKVNNLSFYTKPEARFIPPHELKVEDTVLKGFLWKEDGKPKRNDVVKPFKRKESPSPIQP